MVIEKNIVILDLINELDAYHLQRKGVRLTALDISKLRKTMQGHKLEHTKQILDTLRADIRRMALINKNK